MPYLGDFLGHIMAEITIARMQADLEALRVADYYASHPLLRHMPVPRFRLSDFDVELPVIVDNIEEAEDDELSARGGVQEEAVHKAFMTALAEQLRRHRIRLPYDLRKHLRYVVRQRIDELTSIPEISVDASRLANELTHTVVRAILRYYKKKKGGTPPDEERLERFSEGLRNTARREILKVHTRPPRLNVLVTTREIKEVGDTALTGRLKVKVHEDSLEWSIIERDNETHERLIPE